MSRKQFTLDIDPSSGESAMVDDDSSDDDSLNQIVDFFLIQRRKRKQIASLTPPLSSPPPKTALLCLLSLPPPSCQPKPTDVTDTDDLQSIAIKIKRRKESCALTEEDRRMIEESTRYEKGYGESINRIEKRVLKLLKNVVQLVYRNY